MQAPVLGKLNPIDDPKAWSEPMCEAPLPAAEIEAVQKEIDSIIGVTRGNESQAKLVWNGDRRYWRHVYTDWSITGEPTELLERPIVLYRTVYNAHDKIVRDEFPPRWLILIRREKEQYAPTWERDSKIFMPDRNAYVRVKPAEPPETWYRWFMTIADHNGVCCKTAARQYRDCYGHYAPPRKCLEELARAAEDRRQREAQGEETRPFMEPDRLTEKMMENSLNNYAEQAMRRYHERASKFIDSVPFADIRAVLQAERDREVARLGSQILKQGR